MYTFYVLKDRAMLLLEPSINAKHRDAWEKYFKLLNWEDLTVRGIVNRLAIALGTIVIAEENASQACYQSSHPTQGAQQWVHFVNEHGVIESTTYHQTLSQNYEPKYAHFIGE